MVRRKRVEDKGHNSGEERWLVTYSDMMTLLVVFFIVMYSMSAVDAKKYSQLSASLRKTIIGEATGQIFGDSPGPAVIQGVSVTQREQRNIENSKRQIEEYIKEKQLEGKIMVSITERGLVISLKEVLLFNSGSAHLKPEAAQAIAMVGRSIEFMPNSFRVEGYTDDLPIHTVVFPSNWDLSSKRAINVLEVLVNDAGIKPEKLSAVGYGEYRPLVPNDSDINRTINRRVDIVVLKNELIQNEPKSCTAISNVDQNG